MSRKTWPFIGLEHVIGKRILLGHLEVRLHVSRIHIFELRVGGRARVNSRSTQRANFGSPVHRTHS